MLFKNLQKKRKAILSFALATFFSAVSFAPNIVSASITEHDDGSITETVVTNGGHEMHLKGYIPYTKEQFEKSTGNVSDISMCSGEINGLDAGAIAQYMRNQPGKLKCNAKTRGNTPRVNEAFKAGPFNYTPKEMGYVAMYDAHTEHYVCDKNNGTGWCAKAVYTIAYIHVKDNLNFLTDGTGTKGGSIDVKSGWVPGCDGYPPGDIDKGAITEAVEKGQTKTNSTDTTKRNDDANANNTKKNNTKDSGSIEDNDTNTDSTGSVAGGDTGGANRTNGTDGTNISENETYNSGAGDPYSEAERAYDKSNDGSNGGDSNANSNKGSNGDSNNTKKGDNNGGTGDDWDANGGAGGAADADFNKIVNDLYSDNNNSKNASQADWSSSTSGGTGKSNLDGYFDGINDNSKEYGYGGDLTNDLFGENLSDVGGKGSGGAFIGTDNGGNPIRANDSGVVIGDLNGMDVYNNGTDISGFDGSGYPIFDDDPIIGYDENGNPIHASDKGLHVIGYDDNGNPIFVDENGRIITGFDENGNPIYADGDLNMGNMFGYDKFGNPIYKDSNKNNKGLVDNLLGFLSNGDGSLSDAMKSTMTAQEMADFAKKLLLASGYDINDLRNGKNYDKNSAWTEPEDAWDMNRITKLLKTKSIVLRTDDENLELEKKDKYNRKVLSGQRGEGTVLK